MSDLTATNCGCGNSCGCANNSNNGFGGCNFIWIILLLSCCGGCGGNGNGILGGNCGCNDGCGNNNSCDWLIWILLISCFCGGNNNSCC